jgi:endonuclease-3
VVKVSTAKNAHKQRAAQVFERLNKAYADAHCSLDFRSPLELLISTILAAQCTDERVNIVTKDLFKKYQKPEDYLAVEQEALEKDIQSCGFYRNKAKNIRGACEKILNTFQGRVPGTMDELLQLDGVGRKTANVILGECFGVPGIIVDTHCGRLARRLGFTKHDDPGKVEQDLMRIVAKENWTMFSHCMVFHGRAICVARSPKCSACPVADLCPFPNTKEGKAIAK